MNDERVTVPDKGDDLMKLLSRHGVLCFGGEDWWYHNRGHCDMQYMRQFARHATVVYVNSIVMRKPNVGEGRMFWRRLVRKARSMSRGLEHVPEGFWVYSPITAPVHHLAGARWANRTLLREQIRLTQRRCGLRRPLVWVNCPAAADVAVRLPRTALVYQRTDRFEEFPGVDRKQIAAYDRSLKRCADLTFFSSRQLFEEERDQCYRAAYVDHGVDYDIFASAGDDSWVPPEMRGLKHPIAGFYGGIDAHTFDMDLMTEVVSLLPQVTFVFVGKTSVNCTPLTQHANVIRVDQRPYEQIPHYGKCFDVCLMPWNRNRWIQACNPIKLKEYLALGKPVVSTPFPELEHYSGAIRRADSAAGFAAMITESLTQATEGTATAARSEAAAHSWSVKARNLLGLLFSGGSAETPFCKGPVDNVSVASHERVASALPGGGSAR